jgi:hypothetical protein
MTQNVGNGLGPWWFPASLRRVITRWASFFFHEAAWEIHDASYAAAYPARDKCDRGLLRAMLRDASRQDFVSMIAACTGLAWLMWVMVRLLGWASYGRR